LLLGGKLRKIKEFLKEVQIEFRHVRWPSKDELIGLTSATLVFSFVLSIIVFVFDQVFANLIKIIP